MTSAVLAYSMPDCLTVVSDLLGTLTADPAAVITFPNGLLGFPECRSFILLPSEREHVYWLQSVDYSALAFLMVDPFIFFDGYTVDLPPTESMRQPDSADDVTVFAIVTLPSNRLGDPTANLQGPVVIDTRLREGNQVVLSNSPYGIRESFNL